MDVLGFCGVTEIIESKPLLLALREENWDGFRGGWCAGHLLRNFLEMVPCGRQRKQSRQREESYCGACISPYNVYEPEAHEGQKVHWIPQKLEIRMIWKLPHGHLGPPEEQQVPLASEPSQQPLTQTSLADTCV